MTVTVELEPMRDLVVVRLRPQPEKTGLIVRVQHDQIARWADVVSVGPEVRDIKPGMGVLVNPLAGHDVNGKILLPESAILATE